MLMTRLAAGIVNLYRSGRLIVPATALREWDRLLKLSMGGGDGD